MLETKSDLEEDFPKPLYGQAVTVHGGYLYTVGGTSGHSYFMDVNRLCLATRKWECLHVAKGDQEEPRERWMSC